MATMTSTTLARRSGGTTTFAPMGVSGNVGVLAASSNYAGIANRIELRSSRTSGSRRISNLRIVIPQVDNTNVDNPIVVREAYAELTINVPNGYPTSNVNDLVGFIEAAVATTVTNLDDFLVDGVGVY